MKRSTMELGGSDPFVVLDNANFEEVLRWATWSRLLNCGPPEHDMPQEVWAVSNCS
ncbi:MAG: aldehyde dehydrogenase family protein [Janthinobacterium lividum]